MRLFKTSHLYFLIPILLIGSSCQQTDLSPEIAGHSNLQLSGIPESRISVEEGILVFKNQQDFQRTLSMLRSMDRHEVEAWGKDKGFLSQQVIYEQLISAEEAVEEKAFGKYSHLSEDAFLALNLPDPGHSAVYESALRKGLLSVVEDSDTAHTYYLSLSDPIVAYVINEGGFVMIGDTIVLYTQSQIRRWIGGNLSDRLVLTRATQTNLNDGIYVGTFTTLLREERDWSDLFPCQPAQPTIDWGGPGNKRRCRFRIFGESTDNRSTPGTLSNLCDVTFYLHLEAQRKQWGKWKHRNNYRPTFTMNGSWTTKVGIAPDTNVFLCDDRNHTPSPQTGVVPSPLLNKTYFGNNFQYPLNPHGSWWWSNSNETFCIPLYATNGTIGVTVNGDGGSFADLCTTGF